MINASPYDKLYIGTVYDHDDGHSIIDVWAVYAKTEQEARHEFSRRMHEKGYDKVYKLKMTSPNEYTIKYDYPVEHRKIKNYKGFQRRFVVQIKTTYVPEWFDYSEKYHLKEYSALTELCYAAACRNVTDARIVQILP